MHSRSEPVIVIGAGGHAKSVIGLLRAAGYQISELFDDSTERIGTTVLGVRVTGRVEEATRFAGRPAALAIGDNETRQRISQILDLDWVTVIHPMAWVDPSARLSRGTIVSAGAVVQPEAVVGSHAIINTSSTVDHEVLIGDFAQVSPGVHIGGQARIDVGAFLGIGANVLPGRSIGAWTRIGAGALVTRDVAERTTVIGVPARPR